MDREQMFEYVKSIQNRCMIIMILREETTDVSMMNTVLRDMCGDARRIELEYKEE